MKHRSRILLILLFALAPLPSRACSMCYSSAKATSADGQRAIARGAAILLFPPLAFLTFGTVLAVRYTKSRDAEQSQLPR
jgi:hypothetical protein